MVEQLKAMFNHKDSYVQPTAATVNPAPSTPGTYTAPIHATWHSSGGFTAKHHGVDMRCPAGTSVYPLAPGIVSNVGTDPMGGNIVNVAHANGVKTYYAHLSTANVQKGDKVGVNTVLGTVGNTGNARHTFPHCHFQVWENGQIQDPARFFNVPAYTNLSAQEQAVPWVSEQAKQDAQAFNMQEHVSSRRAAFSSQVVKLGRLADRYERLTRKLSI
jgi:murein DD-endopeptidase MepM/ murein hydrolase activator NlpD